MPTWTGQGHFLVIPENRSAVAAIQEVLFSLASHDIESLPNPLYLHGPSGTGKSYLLRTLTAELADVDVCQLSANDFAEKVERDDPRQAELLIVEDLQHLPFRAAENLLQLLDARLQLAIPTIVTAICGPSNLKHRGKPMPLRLTNRLAAGLVVALGPMQAPSRRRLLKVMADQAEITVSPEILDWLAQQLTGGGRQLEGSIRQLKALQRLQRRPFRLNEIREHFRTQIDAKRPTAKRITEHVSDFYQVPPKQVLSARRSRDVLLPRQISMYLTRQLTRLSFQKIGVYFGGRDHKTVQHACRRIEQAMKADAALSGAVRQMHAELA